MKATVPPKVSKRKAREERLLDFDALADFANLGDQPDDWARFSRRWPRFFPPDIAEWIYINAEEWWNLSNLPDERPDNYRWILRRWLAGSHATITFEERATLARDSRREMRSLRPPLLFYRNLLRRVWRREDPDGSCLKVLLGFDEAWAPVLEEGEGEKEDDLVFEEEGRLVKIEGHVETGGCSYGKGTHQKSLSQRPFGPTDLPSHGRSRRQKRSVASRLGPPWLMAIQAPSAGNLAAHSKGLSITSCRNGGEQCYADSATNISSRTRQPGATVQQTVTRKEDEHTCSTITIALGRPKGKSQRVPRQEPTGRNREHMYPRV